MVKVLSVQSTRSMQVAVTKPVDLSSVLQPGNYSLPQGRSSGSALTGSKPINIPFKVPLKSKTVGCSGSVTAGGDVSGFVRLNPTLDAGIDIERHSAWPHFPYVKSARFILSGTEDAHLSGDIGGSLSCKIGIPLAKYGFPIATIPTPYGPIVITGEVGVTFDVTANATGSASVNATQHFSGAAGASYAQGSGLTPIWTAQNHFDFDVPKASGSASLEAGITPSFRVLVNGAAGAQVNVRGYVGAKADSTTTPWWTLYAGIRGSASLAGPFGTSIGDVQIFKHEEILEQALSLPVVAPQAVIAGLPYSLAVHAIGGTSPDTFAADPGTLPAGLTMSPDGTISGTVPPGTPADNYHPEVTVSDAKGQHASQTLAMTVTGVAILTTSVPNGVGGFPYHAQLSAAGGSGRYSWSISSGSLPRGLVLNPSGAISGTPVSNPDGGGSSFTVKAVDDTGASGYQPLRITIAPPKTGPGKGNPGDNCSTKGHGTICVPN